MLITLCFTAAGFAVLFLQQACIEGSRFITRAWAEWEGVLDHDTRVFPDHHQSP